MDILIILIAFTAGALFLTGSFMNSLSHTGITQQQRDAEFTRGCAMEVAGFIILLVLVVVVIASGYRIS